MGRPVHAVARSAQVTARIRESERKELQTFAEILDISESQILREGLKDKLDQMRMDPRIRNALARRAPLEMAQVVFE